MQPFSFLHCGDVHLGAPFRGLQELSPALSERLRDAPAKAFERLVNTAIERDVAAVVIAGDLFDAADRNLRAQIQLRDQITRLHDADVPSFIAAGNHDPLGGRVASINYPESVHFFSSEVEGLPLSFHDSVVAHVYGVSYTRPEVRDNLAARFPSQPEGPFSIAVLHANVGDRPGHGRYAPCSQEDLESRDFNYWALGHVHTRETLRNERQIIHYPGNPQGLHMKETGPRGATLVEVAASGALSLTPIWTDAVRWHRVRTPIEELPTLDDLIGAFAEVAGSISGEAPERLHIVRWTLTGNGPLHHELRRANAVVDLTEALRAEHATEPEPGSVWLMQLEAVTRPARDLKSLRQQQDLVGDLLRLADEVRQSPPAPPRREIGSGTLFGPEAPASAALRETLAEVLDDRRVAAALGVDPWSLLDWSRLISRAETMAVEEFAEIEPE